jgi:hypothetical protein
LRPAILRVPCLLSDLRLFSLDHLPLQYVVRDDLVEAFQVGFRLGNARRSSWRTIFTTSPLENRGDVEAAHRQLLFVVLVDRRASHALLLE